MRDAHIYSQRSSESNWKARVFSQRNAVTCLCACACVWVNEWVCVFSYIFFSFQWIRMRHTTNYAIPEHFTFVKYTHSHTSHSSWSSSRSSVNAVRWHNRRRGFEQDENKILYCCFYLCAVVFPLLFLQFGRLPLQFFIFFFFFCRHRLL